MKESIEFNIRFVQIVEKHRLLYDNTHCDYTNKWKTDQAWMEVSSVVDETDHMCKERWRNIRGSFLRYLREKSSGGGRFKKPYYLAEYLQFVVPFLTITKIAETIDVEQDVNDTCDSNRSAYVQDVVDHKQERPSISTETKDQKEYLPKMKRKKIKLKKKRNIQRYNSDDHLANTAIKYYETKLARMQDESQNNADYLFLQSLLPDFQCMSAFGKRRVKIAIMKIIDDELKSQNVTDGGNPASC